MKKFVPRQCAKWLRLALLTISLIAYFGPTAIAEKSAAAESEAEQGAPEQPSGPPATIAGFRQALFGMNEEQVRQAIRKDFPAAAGKISNAVNPSEKTMVLSLTVSDLLPNTGYARISYIFGYRSKKLI